MKRSCGILLPISALPSKYGIGTFGRAAYEFVDFLKESGQEYWQMLPIVPPNNSNSPYQAFSTFAGNPYFIDLEALVKADLLSLEECEDINWGTKADEVDYTILTNRRIALLYQAYQRSDCQKDADFNTFKNLQAYWLDDYALFMALKDHFDQEPWQNWDMPIKSRQKEAMDLYREKLASQIEFWKFLQYVFYAQYRKLKAYANGSGIKLIGDMPIYVARNSADVWSHTEMFMLDDDLTPTFIAGVPPDCFSKTGQLWGSPVYDWKNHEKELFEWWHLRFAACFELFDVIRVDHFRGFDDYYSIPYGSKTAEHGTWEKGPGLKFFQFLNERQGKMEIIAEDLGSNTDSIKKLLRDTGYPGMKILQFGFEHDNDSSYLPHCYTENTVAYTGTHDNNTIVGWFGEADDQDRQFAKDYLNIRSDDDFADAAIRALYESVANLVIIPVQDWLALGSEARMNIPSTMNINWKWRVCGAALTKELACRMKRMVFTYRRSADGKYSTKYDAEQIVAETEKRLQNYGYAHLSEADPVTLYQSLSSAAMDAISGDWENTRKSLYGKKQACYLSAEFLVGRAIYNNLYCMGLLNQIKDQVGEKGFDLGCLEEIEDAALGNGGLGRLAACFLDSAASHSLPLTGYGIRYRYGLFKQSFKDGFQKETADNWTAQGDPWSVRKIKERVKVEFPDQTVWAVPYDVPVIGYQSAFIGTLRLWQSEPVETFDFDKFNQQEYDEAVEEKNKAERISMVLYPNDDEKAGKVLRLKQEYFFTSATMQDILHTFKQEHGRAFSLFPDYYAVQLNDTHPVVAIPELVRLLEKEGLSFDDAFEIARKTFAYTNHTVMAEALEKWDVTLFKSVLPEIYEIVFEINKMLIKEMRAKKVSKEDLEKQRIIAKENVRIASLASYASFAINGVAPIHTEIVKNDVFKEWYDVYPEKFQNKTNGITQRRWLGLCNQELSALITGLIGDGWTTDLSILKNLELYSNDDTVIEKFREIKKEKKRQLAKFILEKEHIEIDENFVFDIQIKRLHEYKRQLLNALSILNIYYKIKEGNLPDFQPTVYIFGAKAAPGYARAKGIIKLINEIANLVNRDKAVNGKLKVIFVQNYNVSYAEKLIPAADISEQLSTAGTEASGTGNMKLMLNGAVTLGTYDGANIEIVEKAGIENNYIFGAHVEDLNLIRKTYQSKKFYEENLDLKRAVDTLIDGTLDDGETGIFKELYDSLLVGASWHKPDNYYLFYDFDDYMKKKLQANSDYANTKEFFKKCWINIANAGNFSSDRTVHEYAKDIWNIHKIQ